MEQEIIDRYRIWLTSGTWSSIYWKNRGHWKAEIESKIKELSKKLKSKINE